MKKNFFKLAGYNSACCLSFVSLGLNSSDSQGWPLLILIFAALSFRRLVIPRFLAFAAWSALAGLLISLLLNHSEYTSIQRITVSILIFFLSYLVSWNIVLRGMNYIAYLLFFNVASILFAISQFFFPWSIGWVVNNRTILDYGIHSRGYPSFFPEPSFFGFFLIICSIIYFFSNIKNKSSGLPVIFFANGLSILLLSQSTLAIVFALLFLAAAIIDKSALRSRFKIAHILLFVLVTALLICGFYYVLSQPYANRSSYLISLFISNPFSIFEVDASSSARLFHSFYPFYYSATNYFLPIGLDGLSSVKSLHIPAFLANYLWHGFGGRTMNFAGEFVLSMGFMGIFSLCLILLRPVSRLIMLRRYFFVIVLIMFICNSIPIAFPMMPFMFSCLAFSEKNHDIPAPASLLMKT